MDQAASKDLNFATVNSTVPTVPTRINATVKLTTSIVPTGHVLIGRLPSAMASKTVYLAKTSITALPTARVAYSATVDVFLSQVNVTGFLTVPVGRMNSTAP